LTDPGWLITAKVPAKPGSARVLRTLVVGIGAREGFSYDEIDDLRLALQEALAQILTVASSGTPVTLEVSSLGHGLSLELRTDADSRLWPPPGVEQSLAWSILSALSSKVSYGSQDGRAWVRFEKSAPIDDAAADGPV
jgi:serine/threonine-protein kinase RsbW